VTEETPITTITLDVPAALAERLAQHREQLPQLMARALELPPGEPLLSFSTPPTSYPVSAEMLDLLASGPTLAQILAFKIPPAAQARLVASPSFPKPAVPRSWREGTLETAPLPLLLCMSRPRCAVLRATAGGGGRRWVGRLQRGPSGRTAGGHGRCLVALPYGRPAPSPLCAACGAGGERRAACQAASRALARLEVVPSGAG
jgi:hypothetical protein